MIYDRTCGLNEEVFPQEKSLMNKTLYLMTRGLKEGSIEKYILLIIQIIIGMEAELDDKMGKSKNRRLWILRILLSIYAILYLIIGIDDFLSINAANSWDIEHSALKILFAIFVIGYIISWKNELASGVIFILWFLGMCYENFFLCTSDCGTGIAMGIPLIILSIFLIIYGIKKKS